MRYSIKFVAFPSILSTLDVWPNRPRISDHARPLHGVGWLECRMLNAGGGVLHHHRFIRPHLKALRIE
jgi:hypothetical protein